MSRGAHAADDVRIAWWRVSNAQEAFSCLGPGTMGHTSFCESETAVGVQLVEHPA